MKNKAKLFPWVILFIIFTFALLTWAESYLERIGSDWHPRAVKGKQVSLLENANYPCHVKASGWKILSKRREKMGIFGDLFIKWGWKVIVRNPGKKPIQFSIRMQLVSNEGFILDSDTCGKDFSSKDGLFDDYLGINKINIEWIQPGKERVFQGVSQYNASARKGEGKPNGIRYSVISKN